MKRENSLFVFISFLILVFFCEDSAGFLQHNLHGKRFPRIANISGESSSDVKNVGLAMQGKNVFRPALLQDFTLTKQPLPVQPLKAGGTFVESNSSTAAIDLTGKRAFIAGVADNSGYGWAIAKQLAEAGAEIILGTWPPIYNIFEKTLKSGKYNNDMTFSNGKKMEISKIYPLDAAFDDPETVPKEIKENQRYANAGKYTIQEVADQIAKEFGKIDILVHSIANAPEVKKPLLETSRSGYLAASSSSSFSFVSLIQKFGPIMNSDGSAICLTYAASDKVIPGYGGGMSSAKAALESDTRTLAWEAGRKYGIRINSISAGPLKSRAANAIGAAEGSQKSFIEYAIDYSRANSPIDRYLYSEDVGDTALFLLSPLARAITGQIIYVDNGLSVMGHAVDSKSFDK